MMLRRARTRSSALLLLLVAAASLPAQWPATPAVNLPVSNATGEQQVPKLAATLDGGAWIAWFDNQSGNYGVSIQRLDAWGYEAFPHNGLVVSALPQNTSLVDWDLI